MELVIIRGGVVVNAPMADIVNLDFLDTDTNDDYLLREYVAEAYEAIRVLEEHAGTIDFSNEIQAFIDRHEEA